jgi:hypothetical protein
MASGTKIIIDYDKLYESNNCGYFKIIEELPRKTYPSGVSKRVVRIKFVETGYVKDVELLLAMKGVVKDPYAKSVYGVACLGDTDDISYTKAEYDIWFCMIKRCYNPNAPEYKNYGEIGVRVEDRWLCFENFMKDLPHIPGYDLYKSNNTIGVRYEFDKDFLQTNTPKQNRIYSRATCCFIPGQYNNAIKVNEWRQRHDCSCNYIGLYALQNGTYQCSIMNDGVKNFIGTFDDKVAAANAYNWWASFYGHKTLNSDVPYMPPTEWAGHKNRIKKMCNIVDDKK